MPVHNASGTLAATLDSLAEQSLGDFMLVVVDDGSNDHSMSLLEDRWPVGRLRLLRQRHLGIVAALQAGLSACDTPFIARMDADDIALPDRLALQQRYLLEHDRVAAVGSLIETFAEPEPRAGHAARQFYDQWLNSLISADDHRRELFVECPLAHPSVMLRAEAVHAVGGYRQRGWAEDYDLFLRLSAAGYDLAKVERVLLRWRDSSTRLSRRHTHYSRKAFIRCKVHHLLQGPLREGRVNAVRLWAGAGHGRFWFDTLTAAGIAVESFVDIDPRRVGGERRGRPVLSPDGLVPDAERPVLAAVGVLGARQQIRTHLRQQGFRERVDCWIVA